MVGLVTGFGTSVWLVPNETKSWLVVKEDALDSVREVFDGTDIHITTEGHRYLGGVIGSEAFEQQQFL